jgi:hypothetical protein
LLYGMSYKSDYNRRMLIVSNFEADVISQYLFGKSLNMIAEPNFATEKIKELRSFSSNIWVSIHFDLIRIMIVSMPRWLAAKVASGWMKIIWVCFLSCSLHPVQEKRPAHHFLVL